MKKVIILLSLFLVAGVYTFAQVAVNIDGTPADNSAMLDVKSTIKGMLVPRMTTAQRVAISNPATGLLVYDLDNSQYFTNKGTPASPNWVMISSQWITTPSNKIYYNSGNVGIGITDPATKLQVNGTIAPAWGSSGSPSLVFGDGSEPTGLSSPNPNNLVFITNAVERGRFSSAGNMGLGTALPHASAQLDVTSLTRGFLPPRMTTDQMNAIAGPAEGLLVWNTTIKSPCWFNGTTWSCGGGTFYCGTVVVYGGQTYHTVQIGSQCWMQENLNIGTIINTSGFPSNPSVIEKYCYDNVASNCDTYGGLYEWTEILNGGNPSNANPSGVQGICPNGFHVPSFLEYQQLYGFLGGAASAGGAMKETGTTHWASPNTGATNSSQWTGLPGGIVNIGGTSVNLGTFGYFSTTSDIPGKSPGYYSSAVYSLQYNSAAISQITGWSNQGFSVRCLKN